MFLLGYSFHPALLFILFQPLPSSSPREKGLSFLPVRSFQTLVRQLLTLVLLSSSLVLSSRAQWRICLEVDAGSLREVMSSSTSRVCPKNRHPVPWRKKWLVVMLSGGGKDKGTDVGSVVWHHLDTRITKMKMERRFERRCYTFLNWHGFCCLVIWQI